MRMGDQETSAKTLDEAGKAQVRDLLRGMTLPASIIYQPDEREADQFAYSGAVFENDPVVLEAEREDALADIQSALADLSPVPSEITTKIAALGTAGSVLKIRQLKASIQKDIKEASEESELDKDINNSQLLEDQKYQALWKDIEKRTKEISDAFEKLFAEGKISYEQMAYMRQERERLNALPQDSEERIAAEQKFAEYQEKLGVHIRDEAHAHGDRHTETAATTISHKAHEQVKSFEELHKHWEQRTAYKQSEKGQDEARKRVDNSHTTKTAHAAYDDLSDEQTTAPSSKEPLKMAVAEVTAHDIQSPSGGKDRSGNRGVGKC